MPFVPSRRGGGGLVAARAGLGAAGAGVGGRVADRLLLGGWPAAQTAAAAGLAWLVARLVLGYDAPFYAPIAAVVCLASTVGRRPRRAMELVLGVATGILVADLLVLVLGTGTWQLVLVTGLALLVAVAAGGGPLLVTQAGVSAALVVTITPPDGGIVLDRFVHALVGGGVALLIGQVLFPVDPRARVRKAARPVFRELSAVLVSVANALGSGDLDRATRALTAARALDARVRLLQDEVDAGQETARFAPVRRGVRGELAGQADAAWQVDLAVRNTRMLARSAVALLRRQRSVPPGLSAAVADLAYAVETLGSGFEAAGGAEECQRFSVSAATGAASVLVDPSQLWTAMVVGQVRSTAVDLLRGSGLDLDAALTTLDAALPATDAPSPRGGGPAPGVGGPPHEAGGPSPGVGGPVPGIGPVHGAGPGD